MDQFAIEKIIVLAVVAVVCIWAVQGLGRIMLVLFAVLPFPLALTGAATAGNVCLADVVAMVGLVLLLGGSRGGIALGPPAIPMAAFFATATLSSLATGDLWVTALAIVRMGLATAVALMIFASYKGGPRVFHRCFVAYLASDGLLSLLTMYAFVTGGYGASMYTLGIGKNAAGTIHGCAVVVGLGYLMADGVPPRLRRWAYASLALSGVALLMVLSRGAWISTAAAMLILLLVTRRVQMFVAGLLILAPALAFVWTLLPEKATNYAVDVSPDTYVIRTRLDTIDQALAAFRSSPVMGVGVGLRRVCEPHNIVALTLGETGVVGMASFIAMIAAGGYTLHRGLRVARHEPDLWPILVAGTGAFVVTVCHGFMDVYWRRGASFMGWACVGMALNITMAAARAYRSGPRQVRVRPSSPRPGRVYVPG